ncbi:glycosyl transferase family 2 [Flavobacterium noncentrifugens]|uniref:Glycosyltransferase, GT2 family n=1 Tax=Flavobacterium noncentrifugens TaxID=1128970 RepID=A0A1G8VLH2_9FLAO|nr:glycosyltransferase family 2 protein [Flavobacterium noncentrifugens]GEP50562.1 glycosyl transferase family 2 [Flavobacterium noncentrifugens]SDJ66921.1 Glycosyltransferase, GT2 family [Flavobacterium noncentrifugens]
MKLSVIILNYNVRNFLELCVLSVQSALLNIDAEIIVIDNNSPDDSCDMMKKRFPNVRLIENKENSGFPKGNNIGVAEAKGEYICILNPDTVVAEDTFDKVLAFADKQKKLGIVGCKLIDGAGNFLPESKRGIPTPFTAFTKVTGLYKLSDVFGKYYASHLNPNQTGKVEILVGAFMAMKKETYIEVGGFDENCFMYSDDIDLSYMVLKTGRSNYYFHETTVVHYKGESTVRDEKYMQRFRQAMDFFYKKHFRSSFLFDVFMKTGAFFFSIVKKKQAVLSRPEIDHYTLISNNENMRVKVEKLLGKKVQLLDNTSENNLNSLQAENEKCIEIIFDNNHLSFKSIISQMEKFSKSRFTFRILPRESDFFIGSDNSNDRGEIIHLDKN